MLSKFRRYLDEQSQKAIDWGQHQLQERFALILLATILAVVCIALATAFTWEYGSTVQSLPYFWLGLPIVLAIVIFTPIMYIANKRDGTRKSPEGKLFKPLTWSTSAKTMVSFVPVVGVALAIAYHGDLHPFFFMALTVASAVVWKLWGRADNLPVWIWISGVCIPLAVWGFEVVLPEVFTQWRTSSYFWPQILMLVTIAWLFTRKDSLSRVAMSLTVALFLVVTISGIYNYYWPEGFEFGTEVVEAGEVRSGRSSSSPVGPFANLRFEELKPFVTGCESGDRTPGSGRHFTDAGTVLTNATNDIGLWQINAPIHRERAESFGHDIDTEEGNEGYARILFAEQGLYDWRASRSCWEELILAANLTPTDTTTFTVTASQEETGDIRLPKGRKVNWVRTSSVTYELRTSEEVVTVPAITGVPARVESPLAPWFRLRAVDTDSVTINFTISTM